MELYLNRVTKQYGNKIACDRISLRMKSGVYGLLGANGAGKTTLMRMICGVMTPTSGEITYDGIDVRQEAYRDVLGYLPQNFGYYPDFRVQDFMMYLAALKGLPKNPACERTASLLRLVSLEKESKRKIKTLSGGMKQRLGIAQALLNDPKDPDPGRTYRRTGSKRARKIPQSDLPPWSRPDRTFIHTYRI